MDYDRLDDLEAENVALRKVLEERTGMVDVLRDAAAVLAKNKSLRDRIEQLEQQVALLLPIVVGVAESGGSMLAVNAQSVLAAYRKLEEPR